MNEASRRFMSHTATACCKPCIQAAAFTSIFLCCSTAFAVFGMVMVSTPLEKSATILS